MCQTRYREERASIQRALVVIEGILQEVADELNRAGMRIDEMEIHFPGMDRGSAPIVEWRGKINV